VAGAARLSGTSAAAPALARHLANRVYASIWTDLPLPPRPSPPEVEAQPTRATPTPRADDRYRAGHKRIR